MKEGKSTSKHIYTFCWICKQLATVGATLSNEDAMLHLMKSMPPLYQKIQFFTEKTTKLNLEALITHKETLKKNINATSNSTSILCIGKKPYVPKQIQTFGQQSFREGNVH